MGYITPSSRLQIRAGSALNALVKCWADRDETVAFDLTGYSSLLSSAKVALSDAAPLVTITASVSSVGYDAQGNRIEGLLPSDGWIQVFADVDQTEAVQALADESAYGIQGYWDVTGLKDGIRRPIIAMGYVDLLPRVTAAT